MAFQFQAVAALAPLLMNRYGVGLADIGILIGVYLAPGIAIALPGGAIAGWFGERRTVIAAMAGMVIGGVAMVLAPSWELQLVGRALAGTGGVVLNVVMAKMVTDWFAGREIATAMGIYVNSWPIGIAAALLILPALASGGLEVALGAVTAAVLGGLLLVARYQPPPVTGAGEVAAAWPRGRALLAISLAGSIWALFNGALATVFSFGPVLLTERGLVLTEASTVTSLVLWLIAVAAPVGGLIADRLPGRNGLLAASLAGFALAIAAAAKIDAAVVSFALIGLLGGLAPGVVMSLPSLSLSQETRAHGMGLFFTIYYIGIVIGPVAAGWIAERTGGAEAALLFGAGLAAAALFAWFIFVALVLRGTQRP